MDSFIPWVGSKAKLLEFIKPRLPAVIDSYFEPFAGSASLGLSLASRCDQVFLNDVNPYLIRFYSKAQADPEGLFGSLKTLAEEYNPLALSLKKEFYFKVRAMFNDRDFSRFSEEAMFFFLLKQGFQSLWRENSKGKFNVPPRDPKTRPEFTFPESELFEFAGLMNVSCSNLDWKTFLESHRKDFTPDTLVYFDPPYDQTFTLYSKDNFITDNQTELRDYFKALSDMGIKCILSNNLTDRIRELYAGFRIEVITRNNTWGATGKQAKKVPECLVFSDRFRL